MYTHIYIYALPDTEITDSQSTHTNTGRTMSSPAPSPAGQDGGSLLRIYISTYAQVDPSSSCAQTYSLFCSCLWSPVSLFLAAPLSQKQSGELLPIIICR